ncbi:bifunctional shikimate kinase/3-dehydroquinate synthase [Bifidobacterium avesanii]|uniref:Multifunctional fusion protein n=1 Tax=Bifidobacterium avesanii TaxID=1798157 RepID=A0A7K3TGR7_9BIFI|nr:bifunctional shikimate kinase/3-dehydroquinate synthase [Bifidobacterium avesanii]KAB8293578.1 3-dehydroquinate synthase [Bifidobacterium avesanii]NEG78285.1 bifunctional shikimate kinase/3-dehydroquinate synthase [Bifidobacterium avesanii]
MNVNLTATVNGGVRPRAVIIGMPGAGKTRIGKEASGMLDLPFADSDIEIEHEAGMRIPQYFEEHSERAFRELECRVIGDLIDSFGGVLALGGGAPMFEATHRLLERYIEDGGEVIYLEADPREAMERARRAGGRPMLAGDSDRRWMELFEQRDPVFAALATSRVATHGFTPAGAARKLVDMINEHKVHVDGKGIEPYDVTIGEGAMNHLADVLGSKPVRVALIHTTPVQRHSDRARTLLRQAGYEVSDIVIPDAERGKTIEVANGIWQRLGEEGFTRSDAVVGLGGGAATDLAGFVAATWMRGIRYVNCPTSLLAMVDASTGGKTGINTPQGKNLVGSFYTPAGVLADLKTLGSLPNDIFIEGLGEVAKSGFIKDQAILSILEAHADELRGFDGASFGSGPSDSGAGSSGDLEDIVAQLIERTVMVKAYHVSADLREAGLREFLNYGHTLGHAIEKLEHFRWRHGNAVAVGMVYAAELAHLVGYIDQDLVDYHRALLSSLGLPTSWNGGSFEDVLALMHRDKKARGNTLRFVVLKGIGQPVHLDDPPADAVEEAFRRISR